MAIQQIQHGHGATIYPSDTENISEYLQVYGRSTCLYVGTGGNLRVLTVGGDDVTFRNVQSGQFIPVMVTKVFLTGTTASNITVVDMGPGRFRGLLFDYSKRVSFDGGVVEAGACVDAVNNLLLNASLLLIPSGYKGGRLYSQIPTNGNGDLTWTRTSTAIRTNSSGLLESMGSGVPRLSYMYGSCPSALLEPQRTNLVLRSEEFDNASWTKVASSITANTTTSPDGNTNADSLIENSATANHEIVQTFGVTNGVAYTFSIYIKANGRDKLKIQLSNQFSATALAYYDTATNTTYSVGASATASIQSVGNGWYRCIITSSATSTGTAIVYSTLVSTGTTTTYLGNGTSGLYLYGAQIEAGAYPTTYIPTTSATATRVADSFSRNNIYTNGLISASGGTWFVELRGNVVYGARDGNEAIGVGDTTALTTNSLRLFVNTSGTVQVVKYVSSTLTTLISTSTSTVKIAIKWNGTSADVFINGSKVVTATAFTTTNMEWLTGNAGVPFFVKQMALYPSPLSDTDCQLLTAL